MRELQREFTQIRLFQQHVGLFFKYGLLNAAKNGQALNQQTFMQYAQKIGLKGMSDLYGVIKDKNGVGRFICIEVKTGNAKQTKEQKNFMNMVINMGGIYIVGRSVNQVIEEIKEKLNV